MSQELIETITVGSDSPSTIEFTSIPQDGTDLYLLISARTNDSSDYGLVATTINNLTSGYGNAGLWGSVTSGINSFRTTDSNQWFWHYQSGNGSLANTFGNSELYISSYTSNFAKVASAKSVGAGNSEPLRLIISAHNHPTTSPITTVTIKADISFQQYSSVSLYKITAE